MTHDGGKTPDSVVDLGGATLEVRASVGIRQHAIPGGVAFYLSLYDGEIDERAAAFWPRAATLPPESAARHLELTDAALLVGEDGDIAVLRGGACTFPLYRRTGGSSLRLVTRLPVREEAAFSASGMIAAAAAACQHSSYEPNAFTMTPLAHWRRLRRAAVTWFRAGAFDREAVILPPGEARKQPPAREAIAASVREAFLAYGRSQDQVGRAVVEVSGGFDSTLAAAMLRRSDPLHGVSSVFPYYEFSSEVETQERVAEALNIPRTILDGTALFPYAPPDQPVRWDEPSLFVTGIRHAEQVATFAAGIGAERIYMGHGGDQCFTTDLTATEGLVANPPGRGPFSRSAWRSLALAMMQTRTSPWLHRDTGAFVYDARQDVWVKERFGATIRTPFSDLGIFRSAQAWSRWSRARGARPNRSILVEALGDRLPAAVLERKGKAAYDGVWMRAYARHADHIAGTFDRAAPTLGHLGISADWLIRRVRALGAWKPLSDREVLAVYALAFWLLAWGLERPTDLRWA